MIAEIIVIHIATQHYYILVCDPIFLRKKPVPNISINVEGKSIQQVDRMVYLGYMATEDGKCDKEIKRRIGIARTAFESMAKILTSRNISIELRSRIAKC